MLLPCPFGLRDTPATAMRLLARNCPTLRQVYPSEDLVHPSVERVGVGVETGGHTVVHHFRPTGKANPIMRTGHEHHAEADRLPAAATCCGDIGRADRAGVQAAQACALRAVAAALPAPPAAAAGGSA